MEHASNYCYDRRPRWLVITGFVLLGVLAAVLFAFVFGYFVMLLWNWLMPPLFGLGTITYLQAFGIIILARLIFGSFGHRPSDRKRRDSHPYAREEWRSHFRQNFRRDFRKWKYYDQYWKDQGREDFERYVENREKEEPEGNEKDERGDQS